MRLVTPIRLFLLATPLVAMTGFAGITGADRWPWGRDRQLEGPPVAKVVRLDPQARFGLTVPGQIKSAQYTMIECEVENISGAGLPTSSAGGGRRGGRSQTPAGLTIISLVPEGTSVRAGQVLAEIDPSRFDEIARLLRIRVEEARAVEAKARFDLQAAEIALAEYLDGVRLETLMRLEGQVALAKSQVQQQSDHLDWTNRILPLGYVALSAVRDEAIAVLNAELTLDRAERSLSDYRSYTEPKLTRQLEVRLEQARANHTFAQRRREMDEERLAQAELQIERCTIRAPHDGQLVYGSTRDGTPIRLGLEVYRRMRLFMLPDLERPVVEAQVHQTQIWRVSEGQEALVRVDAKPGIVLRGRVVKVSPFVDNEDQMAQFSGVMRYNIRVDLDDRERLLPGLSAEVEILVPAVQNALTIPSEALAVVGRETVCYVVGPDGVERRTVGVRPGSIDRLQVVEGLFEGEEVILGPYDPASEAVGAKPDLTPSSSPPSEETETA
ncbi:HlyD family secretion protein [Tautonia rosea]|uniref:HlyD family secretion protein n=1 Tax=Tautonia rosea TaxID=2728037 RepID=UPI001475DE89|nr:HlyD family efflux transporter periplasmic adaptor subunit [Tautonia rosea]